jgi:hypothetical protein
MKETAPQNLLAASAGGRRVTIGLDHPDELRRLSDARALTCPGCGGLVVLHAGTVRAHHFAHLPGAVCHLPQTEPETEEHRAGKLLLARWLRERLPEAEVIVEAYLPATQQRADVLVVIPETISGPAREPRRIALEFQCANLTAREWRRRHQLYRADNIEDLWLLGGTRLVRDEQQPIMATGDAIRSTDFSSALASAPASTKGPVTLRTTELERALLWDGAPLLFLDAVGARMPVERLARFRPHPTAQAIRPVGRLSVRPLLALDFPWQLLGWPDEAHPNAPLRATSVPRDSSTMPSVTATSDIWLWQWLAGRYQVVPETLPPFFGLNLPGGEAFACSAQAWQAAIYYRFVHCRVGDTWWLMEVETWARAYLPLARPIKLPRLKAALTAYQEALGAAGMLSLPMGYGRANARITADLTTLPTPPDAEETLRLARYRRTLMRETRHEYGVTDPLPTELVIAL